MQVLAIKTREFLPPKDSINSLLEYLDGKIKDGDVVAISSKVLAICEGACYPIKDLDKQSLIRSESDELLSALGAEIVLTRKDDMLLEYGGVDVLRSAGYYVTLPKHPYKSAMDIWLYLRKRSHIKHLGVVITDSHSVPYRKGAIGMAIAGYGFNPVDIHDKTLSEVSNGKSKRIHKRSMADILDSVGAAANLVMGEAGEQTPLAVVRDVPEIEFFNKQLPPSVMRSKMKVDPRKEVYDL